MIQLEVGIEETFNTFRATVGGEQVSDNTLDDLLLTSDDVAQRREAWEASQAVGAAVSESVLQLVRLRNREAQRLGFSDYYVMSLELQELEPDRLFALLDDLQTRSQSLWETYKAELDAQLAAQFHTTPAALRPWHYHNRFFQEPGPGEADLDRFFGDKDLEKLTSEFFAAIGLPVDDLLKIADLYERPGKCQHAFCTHIDRAGDIRVLCNNRPNERWMSTTLHEFGHAVYDKFLDPALPYLLRDPAHIMTTEAIALFMGRLTKDADWLATYAGVAPEEAARIAAAARREVRDHLLVFMRWCFVMAHFERALYQDPEQDLNTLWWTLKAKYQSLTPPEDRARARLGRQDPPRLRARLLPQLPARRDGRLATPPPSDDAGAGGRTARRADREPESRRLYGDRTVPARSHRPLGSLAGTRHRRSPQSGLLRRTVANAVAPLHSGSDHDDRFQRTA